MRSTVSTTEASTIYIWSHLITSDHIAWWWLPVSASNWRPPERSRSYAAPTYRPEYDRTPHACRRETRTSCRWWRTGSRSCPCPSSPSTVGRPRCASAWSSRPEIDYRYRSTSVRFRRSLERRMQLVSCKLHITQTDCWWWWKNHTDHLHLWNRRLVPLRVGKRIRISEWFWFKNWIQWIPNWIRNWIWERLNREPTMKSCMTRWNCEPL